MRAKAKRRAPRGIEKTAVMHFRVRPETLRAVKEAAAASGRTVSGECEAQLNRALVDTSTALWPILQLLSDVLAKIPEFSKAARWADNPVLFDRAFNVIGTVLEMLRPAGSIRRDATDDERQQWRSIVLSYLIQIRQADPSVPLAKQTREQRRLVKRKEDLGAIGLEPILQQWFEAAHKTITNEFPSVPDAVQLWQVTKLLMAPPVTLSGKGSLSVNAEVIRAKKETKK